MNPDTRLNHYRIVAPLGEGGMGQVYRAEDTRLKRQVAIKVLPAELAADPERLARLEREAQLLAQLEHPNVAAVYGLEEAEGTRFLVMQLVEGETLADRIAEGPIAVSSAMSMALQIAEGLEAAHERGIIHRDLKPANIMVSGDGAVKILDFGLAKAGDPSASGIGAATDLTASPTMMAPTQAGVILGTAAYMSPEQARGKSVDKRTDIWAFGCVLYEMLTGHQGFGGETVTDILAAIVHKQPDLEDLPPDAPWRLRELVERCLEKDPVQRLRDVGDARIALARAIAEPAAGRPGAGGEAPNANGARQRVRTAAIAVVAVVLTAAAMSWFAPRAADRPVRRFALHGEMSVDIADRSPRLSPDGSRVLFYSDGRLWIRDLSQTEPRPLEGTAEATYPIWSPDGEHIAFFTEEALWRMPAAGGDRTRLTSVGEVEDVFWAQDGQIYFGLDPDIAVVSEQGGDPRVLIAIADLPVEPGDTRVDLHEPFLLPDGRSILFRYHTTRDNGSMMVWDGETSRRLMQGSSAEQLRAPILTETGHILYERLGVENPGIWAVAFDLGTLSLAGEPFLVEPEASRISLGPEGNALLVEGGVSELFQMRWVSLDGELGEAFGPPFNADPFRLSLSPRGDRMVVLRAENNASDLWVVEERGGMARLTSDPGREFFASWDLSRNRVVYSLITGDRPRELWAQPLDGTAAPVKLTDGFRGNVSPDGSVLVFERGQAEEIPSDLWVLDLEQGGDPWQLTDTPFSETDAEVSPDGRLVALVSDEAGQPAVHVRSFPEGDDRRVISGEGGVNPTWSPDGTRLYYNTGQELMVVDRQEGGRFSPPREALSARMPGLTSTYFTSILGFGIGPDGDKVVVPARAPESRSPTMVLVQNWMSQLRGRS